MKVHNQKIFRAAVWAAFAVFCPMLLWADVLVGVNGERLVGKVLEESVDKVVFESELGGKLTIPRSRISELQRSAPATNGITHYIRAAITLNNEDMFGQSQRPSTNRHNPYISPGELSNIANGGLQSSDCNNLSNTGVISQLSSGTVPCRLQPKFPWPSNAASNSPSYYPRLTQAQP